MTSKELFDAAVRASGLTELVAPFTVSRLLLRADVQPDSLTREDLVRALPTLESGLGVYLDGEEIREAMDRLEKLAQA